jgi:hypothetical protein
MLQEASWTDTLGIMVLSILGIELCLFYSNLRCFQIGPLLKLL